MKAAFVGLSLAVATLPALRAAPVLPPPAAPLQPLSAQAAPAPESVQAHPAPGPQKYLFVMDVSESMDRFEHGGLPALFDLIHSGVFGHMRLGDTFGLWPFNDGVFAGHYPMQRWDPGDAVNLAGDVTRYLKNRNLSGKSHLEIVLPVILNVVSNVADLNVFIISSGKSKIKGTPFDDEINKIYRRRAGSAAKAGQPLITLLLARHGELVRAGVTMAGEEILMPPRPEPSPSQVHPQDVAKPAIASSKTNSPAGKPSRTLAVKSTPPSPPAPSATNAPHTTNVVQKEPPPATSASQEPFPPPVEGPSPTPPPHDVPSPVHAQAESAQDPAVETHPSGVSREVGNGIEAVPYEAAGQAGGIASLVNPLGPDPVPIAAREAAPPAAQSKANGGSSKPALSVLAVPGATGAGSNLYLWSGLGLLLLASASLGILAKCRRRRDPGSSFITRSMYRR